MNPFTLWLPKPIHYRKYGTTFITTRINSWEVICCRFVGPEYNTNPLEGRIYFAGNEYFPDERFDPRENT